MFLRGVCWGTEPAPDFDGNHTTEETGVGSFSSTQEGLDPATVYYVRAYVVSDHGLAYGGEQSFTTEEGGSAPIGAINGKFSINNSGDQVYFSQGTCSTRLPLIHGSLPITSMTTSVMPTATFPPPIVAG